MTTATPLERPVPRLTRVWEDAPGIPGFFTTVDHKRIGMRYIYTSFFFFFVSGALALVMPHLLDELDIVAADTPDAPHRKHFWASGNGERGLRRRGDHIVGHQVSVRIGNLVHSAPPRERQPPVPELGRLLCIHLGWYCQ